MWNSKRIRLFWWSEPHLMGKAKENFGDLLGKYIVEKIAQKPVIWVHPKKMSFRGLFKPIYVTIGSVLAHVNRKCIIWGSGIIQDNQVVKAAKFLAVRGPETRRVLLKQGYNVPEVYGDPAILLPKYYYPKIKKKYILGIVPHYVDYEMVRSSYKDRKDVLIINLMTEDIEATTDLFLQCEKIVSSSLHGLIVAHAYQISAVWVKFSNKLFGDDIKFKDYFESVLIKPYVSEVLMPLNENESFENLFVEHQTMPEASQINKMQNDLMRVCPF